MRSVALPPVATGCPLAPAARAPPARAPCHARLHHRRASHVAAAVKVDATPASAPLETLRFLSPADCETVRQRFGTPAYVYDLETLKKQVWVHTVCVQCAGCSPATLWSGRPDQERLTLPMRTRPPLCTGQRGAGFPQRLRPDRELCHEGQPECSHPEGARVTHM